MNSDTITNKEVKLLLISHFGDNIKLTLLKQKNRSMLFFSAHVTQETLAETIRAGDPIQECAEVIRQSLLAVDFDLQDRFCDANDLKKAWNCTSIPDPLLKFFGTLFRFDSNRFSTCSANIDHEQDSEAECEAFSSVKASSVSQAKVRQMQALFQN